MPKDGAFKEVTGAPEELAPGELPPLSVQSYLVEDAAFSEEPAEHTEAERVWRAVARLPRHRRRRAIEISPRASRNWALAQLLCDESKRAAADDPQEALDLADLALLIAGQVEGGEKWRSRLSGYAWAYKGNALRVGGHLSKAAEAFSRCWQLWKSGVGLESAHLPEWRLFSLEASLRRGEGRYSEALELLARAEKATGGNSHALASILLNKEFVCEQMGDLHGALATLAEAAPHIEASGDTRLLFALRFETAKALCGLSRYGEAAALLPGVEELAQRLGNEMDLLRGAWLTARIQAGQGRRKEAILGLEQVRRELTAREIPFDAALASLDLAVLYLEEGRTAEVKELAREMAEIFKAQGIAREALAALTLFVEAAQKETATVELVRRVIQKVEGARQEGPRAEGSARS
jgi:tetratricopeptide (TPR) repeat protein